MDLAPVVISDESDSDDLQSYGNYSANNANQSHGRDYVLAQKNHGTEAVVPTSNASAMIQNNGELLDLYEYDELRPRNNNSVHYIDVMNEDADKVPNHRDQSSCKKCGATRSMNMVHVCPTVKKKGRRKTLARNTDGHFMCEDCDYTADKYQSLYIHTRAKKHHAKKEDPAVPAAVTTYRERPEQSFQVVAHSSKNRHPSASTLETSVGLDLPNIKVNVPTIEVAPPNVDVVLPKVDEQVPKIEVDAPNIAVGSLNIVVDPLKSEVLSVDQGISHAGTHGMAALASAEVDEVNNGPKPVAMAGGMDTEWIPPGDDSPTEEYNDDGYYDGSATPPTKKRKRYSSSSIPKDPNSPAPKVLKSGGFQCNFCEHCSNYKHGIAFHQWTHTGFKPFPCDQCAMGFRQKRSLEKHRLAKHTGSKKVAPYKRKKTAANLPIDPNYKEPLVLANKDFKCNHCDYACRNKTTVQRHQWTHTGFTPYKCHSCGKGFKQAAILKNHKCRRYNVKNSNQKHAVNSGATANVLPATDHPVPSAAAAAAGYSPLSTMRAGGENCEMSLASNKSKMDSDDAGMSLPKSNSAATIPLVITPEVRTTFATGVRNATEIFTQHRRLQRGPLEQLNAPQADLAIPMAANATAADRSPLARHGHVHLPISPDSEGAFASFLGGMQNLEPIDVDADDPTDCFTSFSKADAVHLTEGIDSLSPVSDEVSANVHQTLEQIAMAPVGPIAPRNPVAITAMHMPLPASGVSEKSGQSIADAFVIPDEPPMCKTASLTATNLVSITPVAPTTVLPGASMINQDSTNEGVKTLKDMFKCVLCRVHFEEKMMYEDHMNNHGDEIGRCKRCRRMFGSPLLFMRHLHCPANCTEENPTPKTGGPQMDFSGLRSSAPRGRLSRGRPGSDTLTRYPMSSPQQQVHHVDTPQRQHEPAITTQQTPQMMVMQQRTPQPQTKPQQLPQTMAVQQRSLQPQTRPQQVTQSVALQQRPSQKSVMPQEQLQPIAVPPPITRPQQPLHPMIVQHRQQQSAHLQSQPTAAPQRPPEPTTTSQQSQRPVVTQQIIQPVKAVQGVQPVQLRPPQQTGTSHRPPQSMATPQSLPPQSLPPQSLPPHPSPLPHCPLQPPSYSYPSPISSQMSPPITTQQGLGRGMSGRRPAQNVYSQEGMNVRQKRPTARRGRPLSMRTQGSSIRPLHSDKQRQLTQQRQQFTPQQFTPQQQQQQSTPEQQQLVSPQRQCVTQQQQFVHQLQGSPPVQPQLPTEPVQRKNVIVID